MLGGSWVAPPNARRFTKQSADAGLLASAVVSCSSRERRQVGSVEFIAGSVWSHNRLVSSCLFAKARMAIYPLAQRVAVETRTVALFSMNERLKESEKFSIQGSENDRHPRGSCFGSPRLRYVVK